MRVAVEAVAPGDMAAVARGLDLLHRADPLAEVTLQPSGEHVLGAAGVSPCSLLGLQPHPPTLSNPSVVRGSFSSSRQAPSCT